MKNFIKNAYVLLLLLVPAYTFCACVFESEMQPGRGINTFLSHNLIVDTGSTYEPIHIAAIDGDKGSLITEATGERIETKTEKGWTPLHFAVFYGHTDCAAWLLEHGANVEVATLTGWRPLHFAVEKQDVNSMRLLVWHYGAHIKARTSAGMTPLLLAAKNGKAFMVKVLLNWGASCDDASSAGWTALHFAAVHGNLLMAQMLLKKGAAFECLLKHDGSMPVHIAVKHHHDSFVQWLLTQWAHKWAQYKVHPIHIAAKIGLLEVVKNFVYHDRTLATLRTVPGATPMLLAARLNQSAIVTWLIDSAQVDANEALPEGHTALHYAVENDNLRLVRFLIRHWANKEARTRAGCTPLYVALVKGHESVARYLIEQGADLSVQALHGIRREV